MNKLTLNICIRQEVGGGSQAEKQNKTKTESKQNSDRVSFKVM